MHKILCAQLDWCGTALPRLPTYVRVPVAPGPGAPAGMKGREILGAWRQLSQPDFAGMLLLDGDVAIDPVDHVAMLAAIDAEPGAVHTAPVRIWPASTRRRAWVWGHWRDLQAKQGDPFDCPDPDFFTFCYTYLPRQLIDAAAAAGLDSWHYPHVDSKMAAAAARRRIPVRLVPGCWPKHLHYQ